jgi:hypothetical protein
MNGNDAEGFAQRLYARIPSHYRVYDVERDKPQPLLALLRVVGEQGANVRQDLDALWDNFFIETCDDWVVPYLGALVGTNLVQQPTDAKSNRLDVWNTVVWRRSKGTPQMLAALSQAISGWNSDLAEFFDQLGWSQNMNYVRLDRPLNPDLRDLYKLSLLGRAADPFDHALDFKPAGTLDQARVPKHSLGISVPGWSTPGRYQIKNIGIFVRRLQTFPVHGVTPAAAPPGAPAPLNASYFTFDPLFRAIPLFVEQSGAPLDRETFNHAPWATFGTDVGVRQFGILLASDVQPQPILTSSPLPFTFGGTGAGLSLDAAAGIRLMNARDFQLGGGYFVITAEWRQGGVPTRLGALSTLHAALDDGDAFHPGSPIPAGIGQLAITIECGRPALGWQSPPSPAAGFPGAVISLRLARPGSALRSDDGFYAYLPRAFITPAEKPVYFITDDGSSYQGSDSNSMSLSRSSEGQVYPARPATLLTTPASAFTTLNRGPGGLQIPDRSRFAGAPVLLQAQLFTGIYQPLGAIATVDQPAAAYPGLNIPDPWRAFSYGVAKAARTGNLPSTGLLAFLLKPLAGGNFLPISEIIVANRLGQSLLVYLPELSNLPDTGRNVFVAADGSTWFAPTDLQEVLSSFRGLKLARAASGQVLPIPGRWPLEQRRPVAINLRRSEYASRLHPGELGVDPELGRFALATDDPSLALGAFGRPLSSPVSPPDPSLAPGAFTVDYVEAFGDRIGAVNFDRGLPAASRPKRIVSKSGDADLALAAPDATIYTSLAAAVADARGGDVIEIADSATYASSVPITIANTAVHKLTIRAGAGTRPCLTFYQSAGLPASASFEIKTPMAALELSGLLLSGGPMLLHNAVAQLRFEACTLDPNSPATASLICGDNNAGNRADYILCRCIMGGIVLGPGVQRLTLADSIVDQLSGFAIASGINNPPGFLSAATVQLERVTVFGMIRCEVLNASECLLTDLALVADQQSGCVRFTRFQSGSVLPRRYQCVPTESQLKASSEPWLCAVPVFNSRRFGRPDYAQLAAVCPVEILTAGESGAEVGAFAARLNTIRLSNLRTKLREFMPVGLSAVVVAET